MRKIEKEGTAYTKEDREQLRLQVEKVLETYNNDLTKLNETYPELKEADTSVVETNPTKKLYLEDDFYCIAYSGHLKENKIKY